METVMDHQQTILDAAVFAAGLAAVYNADDWARITEPSRSRYEDDNLPPTELPH